MFDLRDALNCLQLLRLRARTAGRECPYRIGIVVKDINQTLIPYPKDTVVLFKPDASGGNYTIELPMNTQEVKRQTKKGSLLVTKFACVGVPIQYINFMVFSDEDHPRPAASAT